MYNENKNGAGSNGHHNSPKPSSAIDKSLLDSDDVIDFKKYFNLLYGYKWLIISITLIATVAAYFYADSITPIYQGNGTMIISQSRDSYSMTGSDLNSLLTSNFGIGTGNVIFDELEVLQSRSLAGIIGDQLLEFINQSNNNLYPVTWREYPRDSTVVSRDTLVRRLQGNLNIERLEERESVVRINYKSPSPSEAASVTNLFIDTYNQFSIDQSRNQTRSALDFLNREMNEVQTILNQNEEDLRDFMNREKLVQLDSQTENLITAMAQIVIERQAVSVQKVAVNSAMASYRTELDNIKPGFAQQYAQGISPKLSRFQYQLAEMETERMLMIQQNPMLENNLQAEPTFERLTNQINKLKADIAQLANHFIESGDNYLGFLGSADGNLANRVTEMRQELMTLKIDSQQYQAQEEVLDQRLDEYQAIFNRLPDNMIHYARLKRDIQINEQLYLTISGQTAELAVWEQTQTGKGRVVDYSLIPDTPIQPRSKRILMLGFVLGGVLSLGLVFLREITITKITSIEKLKEKSHPLLGVIPDDTLIKKNILKDRKQVKSSQSHISTDLLTIHDSMSYASESYRRLLNNLLYSQPDDPFKSILITSPSPAEGKSSVIGNLAVTLAESGKKVLIIDCDLRRPRLHKMWGLTLKPGLVDVLFNKTSTEKVIQPTIMENLDIISSGMKAPNPGALLQSQRMKQLIKELKENYDIVLIDSPPFGIITDAAPLIQSTDGVIVSVRFNQTKESELDQCLENLNYIRANILGTTLLAYDYKKGTGDPYEAAHYKFTYETYNKYQSI
ncbi:MAG: polysaccharide biosynthesis tyrosine autokinase [Balneolales bacterium]